MIAKLTNKRNTHWSNVLKIVEFTINNVVSKATNEYPSMLLFGVRQRGTVIDELRDSLEIGGQLDTSYRVYRRRLLSRFRRINVRTSEFMTVDVRLRGNINSEVRNYDSTSHTQAPHKN